MPSHVRGCPQPLRAQSGEILLAYIERNLSSFLVRKEVVHFKVNSQKLLACIALMRDQLVIAKFLGPKSSPQTMELWIQTINEGLRGCSLMLCRNVGKGFFS